MISLQEKLSLYSKEFIDIAEIFIEFFGEEYIDVSKGRDYNIIYVWWPEIEISNEQDETHTIYDLYAEVSIWNNNSHYKEFKLGRASYSDEEINCGYRHSHLPRLSFNSFDNPCLGSGPIRSTIMTLSEKYDLDFWNLFCRELDCYVRVESLTGGPYIRMSNISSEQYGSSYKKQFNIIIPTSKVQILHRSNFTKIINSLLRNIINKEILHPIFQGDTIDFKENEMEIIKKVSSEFFNTVKDLKIEDSIIKEYIEPCYIEDSILYYKTYVDSNNYRYFNEGDKLLTFKEKDICLKRKININIEDHTLYLLKADIIGMIINRILTFIILNYGKESNFIGGKDLL